MQKFSYLKKTLARMGILCLLLLLFSVNGNSQTADSNFVDGVLYVKIKQNLQIDLPVYRSVDSDLALLYTIYDIDTIVQPFKGLDDVMDRTYRVHFSQVLQADALIAGFSLLSYIEYAEKAPIYRSSFTPNDFVSSQWSLAKIMADRAWDISKGSSSITIAIVDNGVLINHEDLAANIWVNPGEVPNNLLDDDLNGYADDINGWDVADDDKNPNPPASAPSTSNFVHGTHCAGIASASTNNGKGIAAIGFNTRIMAVKCAPDNSGDQGKSLTNAYDGIYYAIRANADIISMSFGGASGSSITGQNLLNSATARGIVLVAAAGNENSSTPNYPAAYSNVISVGASDEQDKKASFSNYGSTVDVMAPGFSIFSTLSGSQYKYGYLSGTSMSCPLVAGLCALILQQHPAYTPAQVLTALQNGCESMDALNPSYAGQLGAGRINAYYSLNPGAAALNQVETNPMRIYPNPAGNHFEVSLPETILEVTVYAANGSEVLVLNSDAATVKIETQLQPGLYLVTARTENHTYKQKLIVF